MGIDAAGIACHIGSVGRCACSCYRHGGTLRYPRRRGQQRSNALTDPVGSFTEAGVTKSVDVNVVGPLLLIQESLPYLHVLGSCVGDQHGFADLALLSHGRALRRRQGSNGLVYQGVRRFPGA